MPTSSTLSVVEASPATWGEARKLVEKVRAGARAWLELGETLEALRSEFLSKGGRPAKNSPHGAASYDEKGWQAKVREELGISDDTARRWMLDAKRHDQLLRITEGEIQQVDGQRVTEAVRERAQSALTALQADPSARPARLWAGLSGGGAGKGWWRRSGAVRRRPRVRARG
jgi:hypothetical protein